MIDAPNVLKEILAQEITLAISLTRAQKHGWVTTISDYPLRRLYDAGVNFVIGTDMGMYKDTVADESRRAGGQARLRGGRDGKHRAERGTSQSAAR